MNLGDYVDVPTRFRLALDKWPDLRVVETPAEVVTIGDRTFISVTVKVYRDLLDLLPCVATAWEPFPGTTPYVRNSEMMNCSTSALGRALGMMIPFGKMASFEEVQNRQNDTPAKSIDLSFGGARRDEKRERTIEVQAARQTKATPADGDKPWPVSKSQLQNLSAIGYTGPVPADWKEANAIIKQMGKA
jgi:hypothetical protein